MKTTRTTVAPEESFQAAFARMASEGHDAGAIAELAVATWRDLDASLSPIIGRRGVDALYQRSLYLLRDGHPWLASVHESGFRPGEAPAFKATFARQDRLVAATTSGALLQTFHGLLATLVGQILTERLLQPASRQDSPP
jgi:hypothetical protein